MDALNVVYEEKEKRGFINLNLISLAFTVAGIGVLLLALGTVVVLPVALNYLGLHDATDLLLRFARWPLLIVSPAASDCCDETIMNQAYCGHGHSHMLGFS